MAFEVVFTKKAELDFDIILAYIFHDFGAAAAIRFKDLTIEFVKILQNFPELGRLSNTKKQMRFFVAHKRLKIYYRIKNDKIIILRLFDTRQHPDKA
ncbi:type II toxin-antitoxin system RelE/ParE family toxin [Mucilaginibacter sp. FT3.2]|uniref:type II toxin-antitoxin system RelE/ParE family toxin n=1 Tax=Mucilaginibacter sp. FT3.2 TaxID=2723090 RepID=UPI001621B0D3|nr:type II toxin-antitoxin system RelE/ParE family toxin [Mucilaginibacter sp. FT3.2]MBB6231992.1 plasmid stabilization system protein ParE [Mucilaginibacter sp. FT3.2]